MRTKIVKKEGTYNFFTVTLSDMTEGKILALHRALDRYSEQSPVANDVKISVEHAMAELPEVFGQTLVSLR